mmetsp:Transcript_13627/g.18867  ORF Transcript_13627/g.18867 Transcript_13627/m.18867 type:complete len:263 (-) Transcript_13627:113-901(-)
MNLHQTPASDSSVSDTRPNPCSAFFNRWSSVTLVEGFFLIVWTGVEALLYSISKKYPGKYQVTNILETTTRALLAASSLMGWRLYAPKIWTDNFPAWCWALTMLSTVVSGSLSLDQIHSNPTLKYALTWLPSFVFWCLSGLIPTLRYYRAYNLYPMNCARDYLSILVLYVTQLFGVLSHFLLPWFPWMFHFAQILIVLILIFALCVVLFSKPSSTVDKKYPATFILLVLIAAFSAITTLLFEAFQNGLGYQIYVHQLELAYC